MAINEAINKTLSATSRLDASACKFNCLILINLHLCIITMESV